MKEIDPDIERQKVLRGRLATYSVGIIFICSAMIIHNLLFTPDFIMAVIIIIPAGLLALFHLIDLIKITFKKGIYKCSSENSTRF
jgi:hypothetical protein